MKMRLQLGPALVAWLSLGGGAAAEGEVKTETKGVRNVAIIGESGLGVVYHDLSLRSHSLYMIVLRLQQRDANDKHQREAGD